jgi:hypothetical protein
MTNSAQLFNVAALAVLLAVHPSTVNRRIAAGTITPDFYVQGYRGDRLFTSDSMLKLVIADGASL